MAASKSLIALITGASSGIGKATALLFASNGFRLSLSGRNESALNEVVDECVKNGLRKDQVLTTIGDVCEEKTLKEIVARTDQCFGRLDVLVNCAGIISSGGAEKTPLSVLDNLMKVNVNSLIRLTQLAVPLLERSDCASIVNVSSITGICAFPAVTYYCISKAAVDKFTECLALELAPKGIRVNAVNPALIVTDLHRRSGMSEEAYNDFVQRGEQSHALGRVGRAEEVAQSILYLARDATFTTGQLLKVDGGKALLTPR